MERNEEFNRNERLKRSSLSRKSGGTEKKQWKDLRKRSERVIKKKIGGD
jgi:hypothetical protein